MTKAWQVAVVIDPTMALSDLRSLVQEMPVWALNTPERKEEIPLFSIEAKKYWPQEDGYTLFESQKTGSIEEDAVSLIPAIELHHPAIFALRFFGIETSTEFERSLNQEGYFATENYWGGYGFAKK